MEKSARNSVSESSQEPLWMQRSVSQLLYSYLPGKTVDWENGLAIVQLGSVRFSSAWEVTRAQLVLKEINAYLLRWRDKGGTVHPSFPDPEKQADRFTIGEPASIGATFVETALQCLSCNRLVFLSKAQLVAAKRQGKPPFRCPSCGKTTLRQFPQIFVHGCGEFVPLNQWMPTLKKEGATLRKTKFSLLCGRCGNQSIVEIPSRSERARDLKIRCQTCRTNTVERLNPRCHTCFTNLPPLPPLSNGQAADESKEQEGTIVTRVLMRVTSYRASEAYYPHTLTFLRLDRPQYTGYQDEEIEQLRQMLPASSGDPSEDPTVNALSTLVARLQAAKTKGDTQTYQELVKQIGAIATASGSAKPPAPAAGSEQRSALFSLTPELQRSVQESLAFKTTVHTTAYTDLLRQDRQGAAAGLLPEITEAHQRLGLRPLLLVDDLPVISATFGFTRRSFESTYEENTLVLPTQLRPFYPLDRYGATSIDRPGAVGTIPILAREGEHEGVFIGLNPQRVITWLAQNNLRLPPSTLSPIQQIMQGLEPIDRYYDTIWDAAQPKRLLRLVFGLLHSLSHAAMRAVSHFAGLERTSISEYLFLPLLGTVIYANSSTFNMGCIETMLRSNLYEFLLELGKEAMSCLLDPDCLDHQGACAGCLHSPEISCRVFNHGLSRAFLMGGHVPWKDVSVAEQLKGYWQT
jgi:DNA-directed RNA polymerase subunit RPC12/RpoP